MVRKQDDVPEIIAAAEAIERDLQRLEDLSRSVRKMRLNSEKSIARAGRALQEALQQQEQLAGGLRVLGEAMVHMQERQQAAIQGLATRAVPVPRLTKRPGRASSRDRGSTLPVGNR